MSRWQHSYSHFNTRKNLSLDELLSPTDYLRMMISEIRIIRLRIIEKFTNGTSGNRFHKIPLLGTAHMMEGFTLK